MLIRHIPKIKSVLDCNLSLWNSTRNNYFLDYSVWNVRDHDQWFGRQLPQVPPEAQVAVHHRCQHSLLPAWTAVCYKGETYIIWRVLWISHNNLKYSRLSLKGSHAGDLPISTVDLCLILGWWRSANPNEAVRFALYEINQVECTGVLKWE